jgi:DnaK suppressor protein
MDANALEQFRRSLDHRRSELLAQIARAEKEARASAERPTDPGDQSAATLSREFLFVQADANRRLLRTVEEALIRIREGTFGECDGCSGRIALARLKAIPWARYCVSCQEELERERWSIAA